jgi:acyl-CoA synthetase (AMP-forming)/AMP-acid ligase II
VAVLGSIFAHARARPHAVAIIHPDGPISYGELAARIVLMRRHLSGLRVDRERLAALHGHGILGGWIVRLALRGLGVTTVSTRSMQEIARLGPVSVIAAPGSVEPGTGPAAGQRLFQLAEGISDGWEAVDLAGVDAVEAAASGGHMLLTSGTTGVYKKVLYDDAAEARLVAANLGLAGITAETTFHVLNFGGWTGANYTWPVLAWSAGGRILVDPGPEPWRSLADPRVTHAVVTPQMLAELVARPSDAPLRNDGLRLFVVGGLMSRTLWRSASERLTPAIYSVYGATESCHITYTRIDRPEDLNSHQIHAAETLQVVDDGDQPVPAGQVGVVRIRTAGVDGYQDDPETTRAFFRDGWFYPGDLGVVGTDGRLTLQGRVTDVINVLGDKVATTPIETALQERLDAEAVCVFSVPGEGGEQVHVAIQPRGPIGAVDLKAALVAALPAGIADVDVHSVKAFPRNDMGKIDRTRLKDQLLAPPD